MNCAKHINTPAVAQCRDCREPVCMVCLHTINTEPYCEACAVNHHQQSPLSALLFSLFVPGLGQVYNGEWLKGVLIFLTGWLILPWIVGIVDAMLVASAIAEGKRPASGVPPGYLVLAIKVLSVFFSCFYIGLVWLILGTVYAYISR